MGATALLLLFVFMGSFSGYVSARLYKMFLGKEWRTTTILSACLFPGIVGGMVLFLNFFVWYQGSTAALPFGTIVCVVALDWRFGATSLYRQFFRLQARYNQEPDRDESFGARNSGTEVVHEHIGVHARWRLPAFWCCVH